MATFADLFMKKISHSPSLPLTFVLCIKRSIDIEHLQAATMSFELKGLAVASMTV